MRPGTLRRLLPRRGGISPKIQFPGRLNRERVGPEVCWFRVRRRKGRGGAAAVVDQRAGTLLCLWIEQTGRNPQSSPRLQNLGSGTEQGEILIVGDVNKAIEGRIAEGPPPIPFFLRAGFDQRSHRAVKPFCNWRRRRGKVGADCTCHKCQAKQGYGRYEAASEANSRELASENTH